ncbi:Conserved putative membrane protein [Candidatus Protochlamydia naegleriophila]|uniref:Conserved putative membrane protein n=1 Tax=Candidatus Protochlamydia naegleriophila TaxID=389348 RepID=A0A0U5J9Z3_9BACT|nr:cytosine permease [Candidatus Protochlamydia naegleriophila]CUI15674.1 Conserved putative membrane protein [Candidatus Protochlamydia naegleriophila]
MENALQRQNWRQLASVQVGGAICLPLLLVGYELAKYQDPASTVWSIVWGNLFLFGLALVAGFLSLKRETTTVEHAFFYFGSYGRVFFGITLALSMLGWFAIQAQCMGTDLYQLVKQLDPHFSANSQEWILIFSLILACLIIMGAFWGLTFLTRMADLCVPLLVFTIGYAVYLVDQTPLIEQMVKIPANWWDGKGVSLVFASSIAATIDLPSFYRHASHPKAVVWASISTYLVAMPLVQLAGVFLYHGTHAATIGEALSYSAAFGWKVWVVLFMLIAGWTTNNVNLYSALLSLRSLSKKLSFSTAMGIAGLIGLGLITIPLLESFASVLDLMGIFVVAMGGIILTAYLLESSGYAANPALSWLAWLAGIVVGLRSWLDPLSLAGSGAPVLDAGLVAAFTLIVSYFLQRLVQRIKNQFFLEERSCENA